MLSDMFILVQLIITLSATLIIGAFCARHQERSPVVRAPSFFLAVFLGSWASGLWLGPLPGLLWAVYWIPFAVGGAVVATLLIMLSKVSYFRDSSHEAIRDSSDRGRSVTSSEALLWFLCALSAGPILIYYLA